MNSRLFAISGIAIIEKTLGDLEDLLKEERKKTERSSLEYMNQITAQREIEYLSEVLSDVKRALRYVVLNVKCEDRLKLGSNGKYLLGKNELNKRSKVDLFDEKNCSWLAGRIEHSDERGGYYFCGTEKGSTNKRLSVGMLARLRSED